MAEKKSKKSPSKVVLYWFRHQHGGYTYTYRTEPKKVTAKEVKQIWSATKGRFIAKEQTVSRVSGSSIGSGICETSSYLKWSPKPGVVYRLTIEEVKS